MPRFDPHDHLVSQGWGGKGTALKEGGMKRPLAVVQKKSLSGIGKDRDEAIPFWDHIFASTAASIASGNTTPRSGTSSPAPKPAASLSIAQRSGKEIARRKLYSGFFRSTPASKDPSLMGSEAEETPSQSKETSPAAGSSSSTLADEAESSDAAGKKSKKDKSKKKDKKGKSNEGDAEVDESKEVRKARREARRLEKAAKVAAREVRAAKKLDKIARREEKDMKRKEKEAKKAEKAKRKAAA